MLVKMSHESGRLTSGMGTGPADPDPTYDPRY